MHTIDILAKFLELHPQFHEQICQYAPNDRNGITVWFRNGRIFDFNCFSDQTWHLISHRELACNNYSGRYIR